MMIQCESCFQEYDAEFGLCPDCGYEHGDGAQEAFCLVPGTVLAQRYRIGKVLGVGGFGITYLAWDENLSTLLAIKEYYHSGLVNREPGQNAVMLVASKRKEEFEHGKIRFLEEAKNMAKFSKHPNIVNVFDYFEANETAYIIMEYLDGHTLTQEVQQQGGPLAPDDCCTLMTSLCSALQALHSEGILHRDISPDNMMICSNKTIKLLDFGAARFSAEGGNPLTIVVKPGFAPPEQYDSRSKQDERTDIYALGASTYYLLTCEKPEESTNRKVLDTLQEPSLLNDQIPPHMSAAIMRAMAVEQQYRYANVGALEEAFLGKKPVVSLEKERTRRKYKRIASIFLALLLVGGGAVACLQYYFSLKNASQMPSADLQVWYMINDDAQASDAKAQALASIVQNFTDQHDTITVTLTPVAEEDYLQTLSQAMTEGTLPHILETTSLSDVSMLPIYDLSAQLEALYADDYLPAFSAATSTTQLPTAITVPLIYANTTLETSCGFQVADLLTPSADTLDNEARFALLQQRCQQANVDIVVESSALDFYVPIYGQGVEAYAQEDGYTAFLKEEALVYLGEYGAYNAVSTTLPGEYCVLLPSDHQPLTQNQALWSVLSHDADANMVASTLIGDFVTEGGQGLFHLDDAYNSNALPVCTPVLNTLIGLYPELSALDSYLTPA